MKPTQKSTSPEPTDVDARSSAEPFAGPVTSDGSGIQWPPVEVPTRLRSRRGNRTLPRRGSVEPHPVLGMEVATGPRSCRGRWPSRSVPVPLIPVPSTELFDGVLQVMQTLAIGSDTLGKTQSSDTSAFPAVGAPSVLRGSEVSDVAEANTQSVLPNVHLHPVLGVLVRTRRRTSGCRCLRRSVPMLLRINLFAGENYEY